MTVMALVIVAVMTMMYAVPMSFAAGSATKTNDGTYTITIKNNKSETNASIDGHTFSAYKLFDLAYADDPTITTDDQTVNSQDQGPHAYYLSTTSPFYTTVAAKTEIEKYFDLTELSGDSSKVLVTIKKVQATDSEGHPLYVDSNDSTKTVTTPTHNETVDGNAVVVDNEIKYKADSEVFGATQAYALAQALKPYFPETPDGISPAATNEQAVIDVSTSGAGYYLVTGDGQGLDENGTAAETVTAAVALTSTDPKAEIIAKLSATDVNKEINEGGGVKYDNHSIGETVPYIVTSSVPNMTGYEKYFFIFSDTLSKGLTLNDNDLNNDNELTNADFHTFTDDNDTEDTDDDFQAADNGFRVLLRKSGEDDVVLTRVDQSAIANLQDGADTKLYYVKKSADGQTFEIVFHDFIQYQGTLVTEANVDSLTGNGTEGSGNKAKIGTYVGAYEGWDIVIEYSATINRNAAIGNTGNVNTAKLIFSNNPDEQANGKPGEPDYPTDTEKDNITGETPESKTITYVTGVKFKKTNGSQALKDAEFTFVGEALKNIVETSTTIYRKVEANETGTYYLLNDGTYTQTDPTLDTAPVTDVDGKTTYTEGTWRLYDQTGWDQVTTVPYTVGNEPVNLLTVGAPWKKAFVEDTVQSWTKAFMVIDDTNGTYFKKKNGEFTTTEPAAADKADNHKYKAVEKDWTAMTAEEKAAVSVSYTVKTSENGLITFTGLGEGEYTLTEIVAPDGYNLLKGPVQIKVNWTGKSLAEGEIVNDTDTCTWTVQYKLPGDLTWKTIDGTDAANLFSLEIVNKTGIELPSTGGIGTTLFYLIGAILIIGAGVLLVTRRRASSMEE